MPPKYSIVIPVFNSSSTLAPLASRLGKLFSGLRTTSEIIFVDDGSTDDSWKVLKGLRAKDRRITLIQLTRNFGQHNAILCGLRSSKGSYVITLDDDLQHRPEEIPRLIKEIEKGYDVVYGVDPINRHGWMRNLATRLARWALRMAIPGLGDFSAFRIMTAEVAGHLGSFQTPSTFIDGYITWVTQKVGWAKVRNEGRILGRSGYSFLKLVAYTANILTTFSDLPMRLAAVVGSITAALGIVYGLYLVILRLRYPEILAGYTSLMAALLFLGGIILFALGVIGEYLGKINHKTTGRPRYIVRESPKGGRRGHSP